LDNTGCLVEIKAVELIELDEMILGALNKESYTFAQKGKRRKLKTKVGKHVKNSIQLDHSALSTLFLEKIIRSSCQYEFEEGLCYEILMTNPVKQGYIYSSERTKVLVVDLSESNIDERSNVLLPTLTAVSFNILNSRKEPNVIEPQEFFVRVLEKKWPEARLCPLPNPQEDDENRVFMRIKDLAKCNIFSGDWVLVSANEPKKSRLCKIYGVEDALEDQ
jgi:peroxin-6